jgi:hypothetical protein
MKRVNAVFSQMLSVHEGPVTGLSLHATGDYILTTSTDHCWAFSGELYLPLYHCCGSLTLLRIRASD